MVRILRCGGATLAPPPPQPRFGVEPAGQDPGQAVTPGRRHYRSVRSRMPVLSATIFDAVFVRAGFGTLRLGLITGWLPVRVLPAPPRSPALIPSSPSPRNTLDFPRFGAGVMARSRVSVGNEDRSEADWGPSSLTSEIRFPVRGEGPASGSHATETGLHQ